MESLLTLIDCYAKALEARAMLDTDADPDSSFAQAEAACVAARHTLGLRLAQLEGFSSGVMALSTAIGSELRNYLNGTTDEPPRTWPDGKVQ